MAGAPNSAARRHTLKVAASLAVITGLHLTLSNFLTRSAGIGGGGRYARRSTTFYLGRNE
jgi:hypothetical protein